MRTVFLLPITAVVAVVAGCGSGGGEQAPRSLPHRDLTLAAPARAVEIASPVELRDIRTQNQTMRSSRRTFRRSGPIQLISVPAVVAEAPAPVLAPSAPVAQPVSTPSKPANDRELLPGKTVTVIPASSGPSTTPDWTDERPAVGGGTMVARGGGRCGRGGRGPGIGIAGVPRPDFR
jgi:hypothetical protein